MLSWEEMDVFNCVDLQDSYVVSWDLEGRQLDFVVVASLWPGHPRYESPAETDWTCYRDATIRFVDVASVKGLPEMDETPSIKDPDGTLDFGSMNSLVKASEGHFVLGLEFGEVEIFAGEVKLLIAWAD